MDSRYLEYNGKLYQVQTNKISNGYVTEILDNDIIVTSINSKSQATDELIKQKLDAKFKDIKVNEVVGD